MSTADAVDGGTGSPGGGQAPVSRVPGASEEAESPDVADLYEYCLSLGIDADHDEELLWVVHEAFNAPLPGNYAEYTNEEGRVYYFNEVSGQSTWEHPLDQVYREVLELVKRVKTEAPKASEEQREAIIRDHLQQVHKNALVSLEGWSGPYPSEQGEYYYNDVLQVSTWECPVTGWENELEIRHAVLCRCLLPEQVSRSATGGSAAAASAGAPGLFGRDLLPSLRLPLNLIRREQSAGEATPMTPSTARSFHTARSTARSGGSTTRSRKKEAERRARHANETEAERKARHARERQERQERRAGKERRAQELQAAAAAGTVGSADGALQAS